MQPFLTNLRKKNKASRILVLLGVSGRLNAHLNWQRCGVGAEAARHFNPVTPLALAKEGSPSCAARKRNLFNLAFWSLCAGSHSTQTWPDLFKYDLVNVRWTT